jgi:hypothetical protein
MWAERSVAREGKWDISRLNIAWGIADRMVADLFVWVGMFEGILWRVGVVDDTYRVRDLTELGRRKFTTFTDFAVVAVEPAAVMCEGCWSLVALNERTWRSSSKEERRMVSENGVHPLTKAGFGPCISKLVDVHTQVCPPRLCIFDL